MTAAIRIDPGSAVAPFEQIRAQYAAAIDDGDLAPGARLPTVRRLAQDLGLAVNTVARAYRELESEGRVETRGRAGTVVASPASDAARSELAAHASAYLAHARRLGVGLEESVTVLRDAAHA
ncbi:GntR family transcriptional regulator [Serinibacter arcticus]|uniref:Transcriptional regulator, GntR family n=1 Tax=Serinibacter arcticus TaxID=1655435 RepID=A0A4Z1E5Z6_9MICO|nr:GntR family transcriptional regulator [Serinibacter arcticus]TGO06288.1 Transcriptional regulator, GntR family [Serinibacter arcticus]